MSNAAVKCAVLKELRKAVSEYNHDETNSGHVFFYDHRNEPNEDFRFVSLTRSEWSTYKIDGKTKSKWCYKNQ